MKLIDIGQGYCTVVDDEDFGWLNQFKWHTLIKWRNGKVARVCAARTIPKLGGCGQTTQLMHRLITAAKPKQQVDHWDNDALNNQRFNLRPCTPAQNSANTGFRITNTSGFKGVCKKMHKGSFTGWYSASINVRGKRLHLGMRRTPEAAYQLYCDAAKKYHGNFANLGKKDKK
jgi:hypothetical protein